ncbi:MAG: cryptochrome/photolyase family protein [Parvularculaceae bacterium]|nr:cryptochrome/photolyase family protein [Parvularculaceae bacterium]
MTRAAIVILGDQLSKSLASLNGADRAQDVIVMGEPVGDIAHANHHKKSIILILSAMRHFAAALEQDGWRVDYQRLDAKAAPTTFTQMVGAAVKRLKPKKLVLVEPGDWAVLEEAKGWTDRFKLPVDILDDDRFMASHADFDAWALGKKALRMEFFYREMRRKTGLLMDGDEPEGGQWNFDHDNRKAAPKGARFPGPMRFKPDALTQEVIALVNDRLSDHFGTADDFWFAVTAKDAEKALAHFIRTGLPGFGDTQDAMLTGEKFLSHSILSIYINIGLLDPLDVCRRAEEAWRKGKAPLNAVEGFIRQIIGWREFIRGVYWREGPDYVRSNALEATRDLPWFYWSGETKMACVKAVVTQTQEEAYAHHIQRLMVTGTFALIAGIDPYAVHRWYQAVYADAFDWVEVPNVIGMSQFADGGLLASKPYAASGAYINRMSNYCGGCHYKVAKKTEEDACPFNALYWDFIARHEKRFASNPRMATIYASWRKMAPAQKAALRQRAADVLENIEKL